jgi:Glu-tRNA(Gln) amidotransferase subunit E-like FAD-binding protein
VGVPRSTIHYLIRRNGARLVDRVVWKTGADLRRTCFLFGERLKGLRRAGIPVDDISADRWCDLLAVLSERPVLWEAWRELVVRLATEPEVPVGAIVAELTMFDLGEPWRDKVAALALAARPDHPDGSEEQLFRYLMGEAMHRLRGKVPAREVADAVRTEMEDLR